MEDTVPREEKLDRLNRVIDVTRQMKRKRQSARTGRRAVVLVEAVSKKNAQELLSRTEHDEMVVFPGSRSLIGSFAEVMIQELQGTTFRAILLS
jgi:tRNA-2-methylthio-N6-dimethylallyladenosine synthase